MTEYSQLCRICLLPVSFRSRMVGHENVPWTFPGQQFSMHTLNVLFGIDFCTRPPTGLYFGWEIAGGLKTFFCCCLFLFFKTISTLSCLIHPWAGQFFPLMVDQLYEGPELMLPKSRVRLIPFQWRHFILRSFWILVFMDVWLTKVFKTDAFKLDFHPISLF